MLALTRMDGSHVNLNPQLVTRVEKAQPGSTLVVMLDGNSYIVQETPDHICTAWLELNAAILAAAADTPPWSTATDEGGD